VRFRRRPCGQHGFRRVGLNRSESNGTACLSAVQFCHLSGGCRRIERVELVGREAHAALLGLHRSADLEVSYCRDSDDPATSNRDVCRLDIDRIVVRRFSRDLYIGFVIGLVERRFHLKPLGAGLAIDK